MLVVCAYHFTSSCLSWRGEKETSFGNVSRQQGMTVTNTVRYRVAAYLCNECKHFFKYK